MLEAAQGGRSNKQRFLLKFGLNCRGWELGLLFSCYSMAVLWTNYLMERVLSKSILHPMQAQCTSPIPHRSPCGLLAVSLFGKISFCSFNQLMRWIRNQISIVQGFQHYYMMASSDSWKAVEYLSKVAQWPAWLWQWASCVHCKALCTLGWHRQKLRALTLLHFLKMLDGTQIDSGT